MKYFHFLKRKLYLGILIILGCATFGSVLGARKESKEPLNDIIQKDTIILQQNPENAPILIGILPLAANQNNWYNFKYALFFSGIGVILYCLLMAIYMSLYNLRLFVRIRNRFKGTDKQDDLFIHFSS